MDQSAIRNFIFRYGIYVLLAISLLLHFPFIHSDPDFHLSHSRDAHSDEGLNTSQIRNFVNYGYIDPKECDNLIKNPLFNVILAGPLFAFGTKLWVGRLTVWMFVFITVLFLSTNRSLRWMWLIFIPITLFQFHVFSYSHFSMAEMIAVSFILLSIHHAFQFTQRIEKTKREKHLALAILFSTLAWYTKIQFLYMLLFVPLIFMLWFIKILITTRKMSKDVIRLLLISTFLPLGFIAAYYLGWFLPLKEPYVYIMQNQASGRFAEWEFLKPIILENYNRYFTQPFLTPLLYLFYIALPTGILLYFINPGKVFKSLFPISLLWVILESHKLAIHFVPSRYLVSGYVAIGLLVSIVMVESLQRFIFSEKKKPSIRYLGWISFVSLLWLFYNHGISYTGLLNRRTYQIYQVNQYLSQFQTQGITAAGPWAPSLTWNTKIRAVPVWSGFLNDRNIEEKLNPVIIFSEPDEADSEQAFMKDGIDLSKADSVKHFQIGRWPVNLYWMQKHE